MKTLRYICLSLFLIFGLFFAWILMGVFTYAIQDGYVYELVNFRFAIYPLSFAACVFGAIRCIPQRSMQ